MGRKNVTNRTKAQNKLAEFSTKTRRREAFRRGIRLLFATGAIALAFVASPAFAQTSDSQLTIDANKKASTIDDNVTSVVFNGAYSLTLINGQTLRPVFLSREPGAKLILGDTAKAQTWTISGNSPSWNGELSLLEGHTLSVATGSANPLGAYSETNAGSFATTSLYSGATLDLATIKAADGSSVSSETKIGRLTTASSSSSSSTADAVVSVGRGRNLLVENGLEVNSKVGLTKKGEGVMTVVANGSAVIDGGEGGGYTPIALGRLNVNEGTFRVVDGSAKVSSVGMKVDSVVLGNNSVLDIYNVGAIDLGGTSGDVVFDAQDGSSVRLYVGAESSTSYNAKVFNTYMQLGKTTLDVVSEIPGAYAPESLVAFSAKDVGQVSYDADALTIKDNILGKNYVVDKSTSTAEEIVLKLVDSEKFDSSKLDGNASSIAKSIDRLIASGKYTDAEYKILADMESNIGNIDYNYLGGETYASAVGFHYMNSLMAQQALFSQLRNNSLVAYSETGASAVSPMDYDAGRVNTQQSYPVTYGGAAQGNFDQGPLYYNTDTNSYAPGVVPTQQQYMQQQYLQQGMQPSATGVQYMNGIYNGETIGGYGAPDSYGTWTGRRQYSTLRGQAAQYGDPGTLIYSAWAQAYGAGLQAKAHKQYLGYDGNQGGVFTGLDLFGSCDCRFGAYFGYERDDFKGSDYLGELKQNTYQLGLYHQFGDENVYTIGTIRGGYESTEGTRWSKYLAQTQEVKAEYDGYFAGATLERGINLKASPFTFSPYAQLDYNYYLRDKFTEKGDDWAYALEVGRSDYHSLRGQLGARLVLDMYPGSQQFRIIANGAYIHEFLDAVYGQTSAKFTGLSTSTGFSIYGNSLGRDWALVGLGAEWIPIPALNLFVKGDYVVNKYVENPGGSAGLKYRW